MPGAFTKARHCRPHDNEGHVHVGAWATRPAPRWVDRPARELCSAPHRPLLRLAGSRRRPRAREGRQQQQPTAVSAVAGPALAPGELTGCWGGQAWLLWLTVVRTPTGRVCRIRCGWLTAAAVPLLELLEQLEQLNN